MIPQNYAQDSKVQEFCSLIIKLFLAWISSHRSTHTQRAYREDVLAFVHFLELEWPKEADRLLYVTVQNVQDFYQKMVADTAAISTINRRLSSLSSFYEYLGASAAKMELPFTIPNPADTQFIERKCPEENLSAALTIEQAYFLMDLPEGNSLVAIRDRALLKTFLYTGIRLGTACRLEVCDFRKEKNGYSLWLQEATSRYRVIELHPTAAEAIANYIEAGKIALGPLFRPRAGSRSNKLGYTPMEESTMHKTISVYLRQIPGAMSGEKCIFTSHSLRATTATLLIQAGVDIRKVQELLGHRHLTTTQGYDKTKAVRGDASLEVPL